MVVTQEKLEARLKELQTRLAVAEEQVANGVLQRNLLQGAALEVAHQLEELKKDASDIQQRPDESH